MTELFLLVGLFCHRFAFLLGFLSVCDVDHHRLIRGEAFQVNPRAPIPSADLGAFLTLGPRLNNPWALPGAEQQQEDAQHGHLQMFISMSSYFKWYLASVPFSLLGPIWTMTANDTDGREVTDYITLYANFGPATSRLDDLLTCSVWALQDLRTMQSQRVSVVDKLFSW